MTSPLKLLLTHSVAALYEDSPFVRYTIKEGMSGNYVTSMQQCDLYRHSRLNGLVVNSTSLDISFRKFAACERE